MTNLFKGDSEMKHFALRGLHTIPQKRFLPSLNLTGQRITPIIWTPLNHYASPAQNFVFASVSGDIAMRIQGRFPVRRKEEGKYILDGTLTRNEWQAFIPNDQNVMYKNPARGFVSSANQYPVDTYLIRTISMLPVTKLTATEELTNFLA
jgi:penicillin amidase